MIIQINIRGGPNGGKLALGSELGRPTKASSIARTRRSIATMARGSLTIARTRDSSTTQIRRSYIICIYQL